MILAYHLLAFASGFILDLIFGDPSFLYHPVRIIGKLISICDIKLNIRSYSSAKKRINGIALVIIVLFSTFFIVASIIVASYTISNYLGVIIESIMTYQILATKSLKDESMKVYFALKENDLDKSRKAVSMIVGRDTDYLSKEGVAKAAIETIAENTSDGVIAPMLYVAMGGPIIGFVYKAVNTMDSMVGYKNEKYIDFGRTAAKLDDIVNYIPARISALLMILATWILGIFSKWYDVGNATRIYKRDRYNHSSPNSAQTEAVCAGALGIRLAGDASYFGKIVKKPYIGEALREVEKEDIVRANKLLYTTAVICELISIICMCFIIFLSQLLRLPLL